MGFTESLKRLMEERKLKQADLCRITGIQTSLMSEYLNGKKSPALSNAIAIADSLNVSLDELVERDYLRKGFVRIHEGLVEGYDQLSDENKHIIERQIKFLLHEQKLES